jgi:lipopolysaccharide/colanic/teichoic acid biosynthesis glycosyltransferase
VRFLKRVLDRLAATLLLVLLSPLLFAISLWILLHDGWPVLLSQERVGKNGRRSLRT